MTTNETPKNVIFVHISPEESKDKRAPDILPELQSEIKKTKNEVSMMHVGILTNKSSFYFTMMGFLKSKSNRLLLDLIITGQNYLLFY